MKITELLTIASSICPDRVSIISEGNRYTFYELQERVSKLANALSSLGVKKGDRIAVLQVNCSQSVEALFAASKIGAVYVPINFRAKEDELTYVFNNAEVKAILVGDRYIDLLKSAADNLIIKPMYISLESQYKNMLYYDHLINSSQSIDIAESTDSEDVAILLYTAGTTGRPKGVMLSHDSFTIYALENVEPPNPAVKEISLEEKKSCTKETMWVNWWLLVF